MTPSPREQEIAKRYIEGECNEIQLNYLVTTERLNLSSIESLIENTCYRTPLATAAKFLLACVFAHFFGCLVSAIAAAS